MEQVKNPHIKICCPVYSLDAWQESIAYACVETLKKEKLNFSFDSVIACSSLIAEGRNLLINSDREDQRIKQTLDQSYTHWLFIDHDVGFTSSDINQLVGRNVNIVSGCYRPKDRTDRYVAGYCSDIGRVFDYVSAIKQGLIEIDWCGGGFVLVTKDALENMSYPWFWHDMKRYGNRMLVVGEDVFFCLNARKHLISIYLDTEVVLNHEGNRYHIEVIKN